MSHKLSDRCNEVEKHSYQVTTLYIGRYTKWRVIADTDVCSLSCLFPPTDRACIFTQITIPNTTRETFMGLLEYLYSDHAPIEGGDPVGVLVLANQFCLPRLVTMAEYCITNGIRNTVAEKYAETVDVVNIMNNSKVRLIKTISPEGTFCDTVQVPSGVGDMQLI